MTIIHKPLREDNLSTKGQMVGPQSVLSSEVSLYLFMWARSKYSSLRIKPRLQIA